MMSWERKVISYYLYDRVLVGLSYYIHFKWHMAIGVKICLAEQKYMSFFGPSPSAISFTNDETLRSGFFPTKNTQ